MFPSDDSRVRVGGLERRVERSSAVVEGTRCARVAVAAAVEGAAVTVVDDDEVVLEWRVPRSVLLAAAEGSAAAAVLDAEADAAD